MPTNAAFATIDEAARFVCFEVPYPRDHAGWTLQGVRAHRSHDLDTLIDDGRGFRTIDLDYATDRDGVMFQIQMTFGGLGTSSGTDREEPGVVQGVPAKIGLGGPDPDFITVAWLKDGIGFMARARLSPEFTRGELMRILESIE
jgi:hypothetical protein